MVGPLTFRVTSKGYARSQALEKKEKNRVQWLPG